jgi:hypothetical protein
MPSRCCEFVDSRLRRSPPDRASAVHGQAGGNAMRFPDLPTGRRLPNKLHRTPQQHGMILFRVSGNDQTSSRLPAFSLFLPGSCPNNRDHRTGTVAQYHRPRPFSPSVHLSFGCKLLSMLIPQMGEIIDCQRLDIQVGQSGKVTSRILCGCKARVGFHNLH